MTKTIHFTDAYPIPPMIYYAKPDLIAKLEAFIDKIKAVNGMGMIHFEREFEVLLGQASDYRSVHVESYTADGTSINFDLVNPLVDLLEKANADKNLPKSTSLESALQQPRTLNVEIPWIKVKAITGPAKGRAIPTGTPAAMIGNRQYFEPTVNSKST